MITFPTLRLFRSLRPFSLRLVLLALALHAGGAHAAGVASGRLFEGDPVRGESGLQAGSSDTSSSMLISGLPGLLAGPVDEDIYLLGPGDVLSLERATPSILVQMIPVDAEGALYIPDLGRRVVAGRSLASVRLEILRDLKKFFPTSRIEMRLIRPRAFKVFLLGEVAVPGAVGVGATNRAVDALEGRGVLAPGASQRNIRLMRANGTSLRVDVQSFLLLGDQSHNPWLQDGDRILVPRLKETTYVAGSVGRPGAYELAAGDSASTVIRLAGGLMPEARTDSILLVRFRTPTQVDSLWLNAESASRTAVQADDRIFVRLQYPFRRLSAVNVMGEVRFPGEYPIEEGRDHLSDILTRAGGFTPLASPSSVVLQRQTEFTILENADIDRLRRLTRAEMTESEYYDLRMRTNGRATLYAVDASGNFEPGSRQDVLLLSGDAIRVPSRTRTVRVGGEVKQPGLFAFSPALEPRDYIQLAGGYGPRADGSQIRVIRSADGQSLPAREVAGVSPGDYVWVPEKSEGTPTWTVFKEILAVTGQIATIILLINNTKKP